MARRFALTHVVVAVAIAAAGTTGVGLVPRAGAAGEVGGVASYQPIVPCRLVDTRPAPDKVGTRSTPLQPTESVTFAVWGINGNCDIPTTAIGIATNATAVNPTAASYVTIFPADAARPTASNLNVVAGSPPTPNQVTVGLSAAGAIAAYNNGGTLDLIIDIVGYYVPAAAGGPTTLLPHDHDDRYYTKSLVDADFVTDEELFGGYYNKAQIDNDTTTKVLSFPGDALDMLASSSRDNGVKLPYGSVVTADLFIARPSDYVANTAVSVKLFFLPATAPPAGSTARFFARPRQYNGGDSFLDELGTNSQLVTLSSDPNRFYEATITFGSSSLAKAWWDIVIQRDGPIAGGYTGEVRIKSVAISYTAYTSQG